MSTLFSIIVPSFQQGAYLGDTLDSIIVQQAAKEIIVADGGSTDESVLAIKDRESALHWWCSEPDEGQSHAINKGLEKATGTIFNWLNSDDLYTVNALARVHQVFEENPDALVVGGRIIHRSAQGDAPFDKQTDASHAEAFFVNHAVLQPATFFRMQAVKQIGGVEERLRYVMDLELWWQFVFRYGTDRIVLIPDELAIFRIHDDSKTTQEHRGFLDETASILHGLCSAAGHLDLCVILEEGYALKQGLRAIPITVYHHGIIRKMVHQFLLKWNGTVHDENQFRMMKRYLGSIKLQELEGNTSWQARYTALQKSLRVPNWFMYRLNRKIRS